MSIKYQKLFIAFSLIPLSIVVSACAVVSGNSKPGPLIIQEQGSFAVGGTVMNNPGPLRKTGERK